MKSRQAFRRGAGGTAGGASCCPRCGEPFQCGIDDAAGCWCARLPALPREAYPADAACLCESCLRQALREAGSGPAAASP